MKILDTFNQGSYRALKGAMEGSSIRNKLIANNIANSNTPDYVAQDLQFRMYMKMAMEGADDNRMAFTDGAHFRTGFTGTDEDPTSFSNTVQNQMLMMNVNTSTEDEMVKLSENAINYRTATDMLSRSYAIMRTAITGGVT